MGGMEDINVGMGVTDMDKLVEVWLILMKRWRG